MSKNLIISVPKQNNGENKERRNLNQYIFGEIGLGPKVIASTDEGIYIAEKSPYPSIARSGGDIQDKLTKVDQRVDSMGITYDNTKLDNVTHDQSSDKFHIIDAGGSRVPPKLTTKYGSSYANIKKPIKKEDINNYIKTNNIGFTKIGSGDSRDVYEIDDSILNLFK